MAAADNMTAEDEAAVDNMVLGSVAADESGGERWGGEGSFSRKNIEVSALEMRNYDLATLQADDNVMGTLNGYGSREDLEGVLGNPAFEERTNKIQIGYQ